MKFSIIIPVYNGAATLPRTLDSVADLPDAEVLVINDGSTDETGSVLREYSEKYPNFRIFYQENRGVSAARNVGLRHARGEYLLFLDGDDTLAALPDPERCGRAAPSEALALFREERLCQLWNKVFRAGAVRAHQLQFREELFVYEDLEFVAGYLASAGELLLAPGMIRHTPSGQALDRAGRLSDLAPVLDGLPGPLGAELAPILARQVMAAVPHRAGKIFRELGKYCPNARFLPLFRGALALRWRG